MARCQTMAGMTWEEAIKKGLVLNAAQACTKWKIDGLALDKRWSAGIADKKNIVKFGGGFYVGKVREKSLRRAHTPLCLSVHQCGHARSTSVQGVLECAS